VNLSDDLPSPRRPLFFPVVIATVLLTIIGMSAGIALASWHQGSEDRNNGQQATYPTYEPSPETPSGPPCREETQQAAVSRGAQGTLRIQLLLRTKTSAVWICEDEAGQFFYHGNRGGENAKWIENQTALFLAGVQRDGDGRYVVTATDGTRFTVTAQRLVILHKDGREEVQEAVD